MRPSVYIETSIPSYYFETRADAKAMAWRNLTRNWWDHHSARYRSVSSIVVLEELQLAPPEKAARMLTLMKPIPMLAKPPGIDRIVSHYIENRLLPATVLGDAYHLAFASMHRVDFLLTWNCRHLANANKIRHIAVINGRLGLSVPVITTPMTLLPEVET